MSVGQRRISGARNNERKMRIFSMNNVKINIPKRAQLFVTILDDWLF